MFDLLFMFQHYVLFRKAVDTDKAGYNKMADSSIQGDTNDVMEKGNVAADETEPLLGEAKKEKSKLKNIFKIKNKNNKS